MRLLFYVFFAFFSSFDAFGQPTVTLVPARILDFGELYSTFDWGEESKAELRSKLGDELAAKVMAASNEAAWPSGIASLEGRTENRAKMAAFNLNHLITLADNKAVLVAKVADNPGLSENMKINSDIYFVVNANVVELNGPSKSYPNTTLPQEPATDQDFSIQLNQITQDFDEGFVNLTGSQIGEDEEGMIVSYGSRVPLEGSSEIYFTEDLLSASTTFIANFPASTDPATTLKIYRNLVKKIEGTNLSCCSLSKQVEQADGNRYSQSFSAYDPTGKLHRDYQNMIVEVRIEQGETFDSKGQLVSKWIPVVSVYEQ